MPPAGDSDYRNGHVNGHVNGHAESTPSPTINGPPIDLSKLVSVESGTKAFSSRAVSLVSLPRGSLLVPLVGLTESMKSYSSLQISRTEHVQLNSSLLYCNHSCEPTVEFDTGEMVLRVARDKDLRKGDPLTFWYPSTEWEMAQPFECSCASKSCKGWISGAKDMSAEVLAQYWLNKHIQELLEERKGKASGNAIGNGH
jgi:hypothetical protein